LACIVVCPVLGLAPSLTCSWKSKLVGNVCLLNFRHVTGCPAEYLVTGSVFCSDLCASGWFRPELRIQWADFDMTHKPTERPLVLSSRYRISLLQRFQLSSLFTNKYMFVCCFFNMRTICVLCVALRPTMWNDLMVLQSTAKSCDATHTASFFLVVFYHFPRSDIRHIVYLRRVPFPLFGATHTRLAFFNSFLFVYFFSV